ncbi:MAG: hypothetical protein LBB18_00575 [Puniceicoccales bacterium]|jgi:hypothetical protein|nr:hypothetical protein [Puniceicoccales bacterium]
MPAFFSIEQFSEFHEYVVGKDCDESVQKAAFRTYELAKVKAGPHDFLVVVSDLLKSELQQMPLPPLAERGIKKFVNLALVVRWDRVIEKTAKTPAGRAKIMEILGQLAKLRQFDMLKKILLEEGEDDPPTGYTLYRSEQKDAVMALINSLPKEFKDSLLHSTWTYYCGGNKIGGEKIFGYGSIMPL